eukprot:COSAG06_NODE_39754_length_409_cov_0.783871_1_plen_116_part_10
MKSVRGGKRRTTVGVPSRSRFSSNGSSECGLLGTHTMFLLGSSCTQVKPATRRPSSCLHNVLCRKRCSTQHNGIDVSGTQMRSNQHERQGANQHEASVWSYLTRQPLCRSTAVRAL